MTRVLVASPDRVGRAMAGPAIRCWEMARLLSEHGHEVCLAANGVVDPEPSAFRVVVSDHAAMADEAARAEVIVVQGLMLLTHPELKLARKRLVVDLYDPVNLEILELFHDHPWDERVEQHDAHRYAILDQLHRGDFFLCASDKQRDYWLGMLAGAGRVNPHTHDQDRLLRNLIDVVPFGTSATPPEHSGEPAARGVLPGIEDDAQLVLWAGGVYNWFDPLSLIRAWPAVLARAPRARLLFMGMKHPNPDVPEMAMAGRAVRLSEELGLRDRGVHFNMGWVPYDRRKDFLLEADLGVSTHFDHVETAFSFRTRILDYIWAGLPIVATEGDEFARLIRERGLGRVVGYEDDAAIADAVAGLLEDPAAREAAAAAVRQLRPDFTWERSLAPLLRYCADPWRAPDLVASGSSDEAEERDARLALGSMRAPRGLVPRMTYFVREEGVGAAVGRVLRTLRRRITSKLAGDRA
jgi:glycosyltransferase involved in cell wall biosynthesis